MSVIKSTIEIKASKAAVWKVIGDPLKMADYHPMFNKAEATSKQTKAVGSTLRWHFENRGRKGYFDERISELVPNQSLTTENIGGENIPPFKKALTTLKMEAGGGGTILVTLAVNVEFKGLAGPILNFVSSKQYKKILPGILASLKNHIEG